MLVIQHIEPEKLKALFIQECRGYIPKELTPYEKMWEASAVFFFDAFLNFLNRQGLEISFSGYSKKEP